jgi:hypothetical protein
MLHFRRSQRADISGAIVTFQGSAGGGTHAVLNLSTEGMLVEGTDLPVGHPLRFVLQGYGVRCLGRGHVAHRTEDATGITVDGWTGPADVVIEGVVRRMASDEEAEHEMYVAEWA